MAYEAGNLQVKISGIDDSATQSIGNVVKRLNSLRLAIEKLNRTQTVMAGNQIDLLFTKIANATTKIDTTKLQTLASVAKSLSSITRIGGLEKVDFSKVASGFGTLTTAITPFINKVKEAETSLTAMYGILQKSSGKKIQNLLDTTATKSKKSSTDKLFNLAKITMFYRMARRVGSAVANIVQYGVDYTETLNLWTVAMRDNLTQADEFIKKMNRAYGISEKTLMNSQAIFKNMLGSLGQISGDTAYALSEALVQMSADFASLYNVSFQSALTKMQAMLAGQVRPIRSAGLDMTETTLFQYYQAMGGTKTMRQLTRTEKQLLSIYAVFQQMSKAGALGDMQKTLNQFANQSRMANENFQTMLTWAGVIGKKWIENTGILVYVNALLITMGDILRAIAGQMGAINNEDFLDKVFETTESTNKEMDELQGKLLDFDKFRSLSGAEENTLGIDEKLLQAISGYSSVIDESKNAARQMADEWLKVLGFTEDENGQLTITKENLNKIENTLKTIGIVIGVIVGFSLVAGIGKLIRAIFTLKNAVTLLNVALITGVVIAVLKAVQAFKDGNIAAGILSVTIGVALAGAFIFLHRKAIIAAWQALTQFIRKMLLVDSISRGSLLKSILGLSTVFIALGAAIAGAFFIIKEWGNMNTWQRIIGIIGVATTAILGLALAFGAFHSAWSLGLAVAGIAAGIGAIVASIATVKKEVSNPVKIPNYAVGASDIDSGTIFRAGEFGRTEAVYTGSNGKTNVANISQMQQAFYGALVQYGRENRDSGSPIVIQIDGKTLFEATNKTANKKGLKFARA